MRAENTGAEVRYALVDLSEEEYKNLKLLTYAIAQQDGKIFGDRKEAIRTFAKMLFVMLDKNHVGQPR